LKEISPWRRDLWRRSKKFFEVLGKCPSSGRACPQNRSTVLKEGRKKGAVNKMFSEPALQILR
jgi:hypothetical protein